MPDPIDPKLTQNGTTVVADPDKPVVPATLTADDVTRIVDAKLGLILERLGNVPAPVNPAGPGEDPLDAIAKEIAEEEGIKPEVAKSFVNKFVKLNEHLNKGTKAELDGFKLRDKFAQVFSTITPEDAAKIAPRMTEVFNKMSPLEKNFVLNSPDGAKFIFNKAKEEMGMYVQPADARAAASLPSGRTLSPDRKMGGNQEILDKASTCLAKGDRRGYEDYMSQITRG